MRIALTGATGFLGRYLVTELVDHGHELRAWYRPSSDRGGFSPRESAAIDWVEGELAQPGAAAAVISGCDAVVHAGLYSPGRSFQGAEGDLPEYVRRNVLGTMELIEAARQAQVSRFVFISSCAVHDVILEDRPLDEAHPLWPKSVYGAHKAAIEKFIHAYGLGDGWPICSLRPCGIYGVARPVESSRWFDLAATILRGDDVSVRGKGKVVHAADVAKAVELLLHADSIAGQAYNCCDRSVSEFEVATLLRELSGSSSKIDGQPEQAKHQISTAKIKRLGMQFGGTAKLRETLRELLTAAGGIAS